MYGITMMYNTLTMSVADPGVFGNSCIFNHYIKLLSTMLVDHQLLECFIPRPH